MTTHERTMVIGAFRDYTLVDQALQDLRDSGWHDEQIKVIGRRQGGLLSAIKSAFGEPEATAEGDDLAQLDLPDEERQLYTRERDAGSSIVAVQAGERQLEARDILHRHGAYNVYIPLGLGGERIIPLRREEAQVQKRIVEVGEIRIHKRVITEQRTFTVPVIREEVTIERIPHNTVVRPYAQPGVTTSPVAPGFPDAPSAADVRSADYPVSTSQAAVQSEAVSTDSADSVGTSSYAAPANRPYAQPGPAKTSIIDDAPAGEYPVTTRPYAEPGPANVNMPADAASSVLPYTEPGPANVNVTDDAASTARPPAEPETANVNTFDNAASASAVQPAVNANVQRDIAADEVLPGDGVLRILVHEEQVMIAKQPVVVEEILINKRTLQETRQLVEPIRHEEIRLENIGNVPVHESGIEDIPTQVVQPEYNQPPVEEVQDNL